MGEVNYNIDLRGFIDEISRLISSQSGTRAALLFRSHPLVAQIPFSQLESYQPNHDLYKVPAQWKNIIDAHIQTRYYLVIKNYKAAFESQSNCCKYLNQQLTNWKNWVLPIVFTLMKDLKSIAIQTDIAQNINQTSGCNLEEATHIMNRAFTICLTHTNTNLKKSVMLGTYGMINILLSVHSYLNTLDLCKSLFHAVQSDPDLPSIEHFPKADQVTFHYYYGRMEFLKEKFVKAEEHLIKAFTLCHKNHVSNQRRILIYLIPLLINKGIFPEIQVLARHRQLQKVYGPLLNSIYEANYPKLIKLITKHHDSLCKWNVVMMFERLKLLCLRNLCKKIYINLDRPKRLTFQQIQVALNWAGFEADEEEAVGVFSTLISKGYIAGYIAYSHNVVMISQKTWFPKLPLSKSS